ncbi:MAG: peptidoglycan DD-metalloendopeptidase family protein [Ruminococcus sp.]|nr:peptidoglycan DD-metalloendopeptidase family protein [Ruminococcus sp.]
MRKALKKAAAAVSAAALLIINFTVPLSASATDALWPTEKEYQNITTYFDPNRNIADSSAYHNAVDIEAAGGTNIYAVYPGTVVSADWKDAYGYLIILRHDDLGIYTFYAHCSQILVSAGQSVAQGDVIGLVGSTGQSSGNHLHYGICNNLASGWPTCTYYDPLTYFTYVDNPQQGSTPTCSCSEEYAGIYTTKGLTTYLNIRSGHGTSYSVIGSIYPGDTVIVTKSDGTWAHVTANGVSGYCSMEYLQKTGELTSSMSIKGQTYPEGPLTPGAPFSIKGVISSSYPITKVWGGVYDLAGEPTAQYIEIDTNSSTYDLNTYFDKKIIFNALPKGQYIYSVKAQDSQGEVFELVRSEFSIGEAAAELVTGDTNGDGAVTIADLVNLQKFLLGNTSYSSKQYAASDLDGDKKVNGFDLAFMRMELIKKAQEK